MEQYPAHIRRTEGEPVVQTVRQHSRSVAQYAAERMKTIGLGHLGRLAGMLHDAGKLKREFAEYLQKAAADPDSVRRGSVNHTFAGCRYILEEYHRADETGLAMLASELIAYAVGAHHGRFDCVDSRRQHGFDRRLTEPSIGYDESIAGLLSEVASRAEIDGLFARAKEELVPVCVRINGMLRGSRTPEEDGLFYYGLLERFLLSALIEADRRDTAEFMDGRAYPVQPTGEARAAMWQRALAFAEQKLSEFPQDKPILAARREISERCAAFALRSGGIFRLNVPTGGGKTLASLRYALAHAGRWNRSRIILTSSLLSVLDQNVAVIRSFLPDDMPVLEHHSNVIRPAEEEERIEWEMMTEQYSAPIVITTLVQLLDTLFSDKTACIRRFQALADSVIVIDEVQTVPTRLLTLFDLAVNFLANVCHASVLLCSATQPALELAAHPLLYAAEEPVPYDPALWAPFRRTEIRDAGAFRMEEIPAFIREVSAHTVSLLVIANTKAEAQKLFYALADGPAECVHLSAGMCMAHRRRMLERVYAALAEGRRLICISTQVIEAGVDISFAGVIRLAAGLDSVVQAAGRCNRNGESGRPAPVYIVRCTDERLEALPDIQRGKIALEALLVAYAEDPGRFSNDLTSSAAIRFYYRTVYAGLRDRAQDDLRREEGCTAFSLLSKNESRLQGAPAAGRYLLNQAFYTAWHGFSVFSQDTADVIVPYGGGRELIDRLFAMERQHPVDYAALEELISRASVYTVPVYPFWLDRLTACGGIAELFGGRIRVLLDGFYDETIGLLTQSPTGNLWEV